MSAPSAETSNAAAPGADASTRPLLVVWIALGLACIGAVVASFFWVRAGPIDARAELERLFEPFEMPYGLEPEHGLQFPQGVRAVVFADPAAEPEPPAAATPEPETKTETPADPAEPRFDWTKVAIGAGGKPPRRVTLYSDPDREGVEIGREQGPSGMRNVKDLGPAGGVVTIEIGKIPWHEYNADYVHERSYERGGTFQDSIRVNLSANGRGCTLRAQWTRGDAGSKAQVEEILAALQPKPRIE